MLITDELHEKPVRKAHERQNWFELRMLDVKDSEKSNQ
jgi:hypothetical protein